MKSNSAEDNKAIILALDGLTMDEAEECARLFGKKVYALKVHGLCDQYGTEKVITNLKAYGARKVWVDYKLHDIPNAVEERARRLAYNGADIISVHAAGEIEMMQRALTGIQGTDAEIFAVTTLTSQCEEESHLLTGHPVKASVLYNARLAKLAGVHGVVCSPQAVGTLSQRLELKGLKFITPGVRFKDGSNDDQKQVATPKVAIISGATHIVVGRPVLEGNRQKNFKRLEDEVFEALFNGGFSK